MNELSPMATNDEVDLSGLDSSETAVEETNHDI